MKTRFSAALLLAACLAPQAAFATGVCYVSHDGTLYSSFAFDYKSDGNIDQSPQAKAFAAHVRQVYGTPEDANLYCRNSVITTIAEENDMRGEGLLEMGSYRVNEVKTSFQPESD